jgi:hypothetical protein
VKRIPKQTVGYGLVFLVLIGFLIYAIVSTRDSHATPAPGITKIQKGAVPPSLHLPPSPAAGPSTPKTKTAVSGAQAARVGEQLANVGPGNTLTIFVVISLLGTLLFHYRQTKTIRHYF